MKKIIKAFRYIFTTPSVVLAYLWLKMSPFVPAKLYLTVMYRLKRGYWMDFKNPVKFNEKLQVLKLNEHNREYIQMVDKYKVKFYVAKIIGNEYIIPTLGVWDRFEDINFEALPNQFVLKCTHDSGGIVICKDKKTLNINEVKNKIKKSLSTNYYHIGKEWPYKYVRPRVIAEAYMEDEYGEFRDYKFFCFGGSVNFFKVDFGRFTEHHANYYLPNGELLHFGEKNYPFDENANLSLPCNLGKMIELAEKLSANIPFVRVDFYNCKGQIFFGELTFYPFSGFGSFSPEEWDNRIGEMLLI